VSGVVSAIVAGAISLAVAHYQNQAAAQQATSAQQAAAIVQLETATNTFYQATLTQMLSCFEQANVNKCPNGVFTAPWAAYHATFNADRANVSDPSASALAEQLDTFAGDVLDYAGFSHDEASSYFNQMTVTYQQLIARCGLLVRS
jgi:hypothetical protein